MDLANKKIGFALTGSFCTFDAALLAMEELVRLGADVVPIFSYHADQLQTRYISGGDLKAKVREITKKEPLATIPQVEPIGPKKLLDALVIAPATGNSISKLANGITDTPPLMAAKSTMRNGRPVLIAASTNDGLGMAMKNIGLLMNAKNIFFVPFGQDGPLAKPNSLSAKLSLLPASLAQALEGRQMEPVLLGASELA
jgi:dipicolinate synthase subunit B